MADYVINQRKSNNFMLWEKKVTSLDIKLLWTKHPLLEKNSQWSGMTIEGLER